METIHTIINHVPSDMWYALIGGPVVSIVLQKFKKWLGVQSEKVVVFTLFLFSFIGSAISYFASAAVQNPMILGPETAMILSVALGFYHLIGKPFTNLLQDAKALRESAGSRIPEAAASAAAVGAAAGLIPAATVDTTTPTQTYSPPTDTPDFGA